MYLILAGFAVVCGQEEMYSLCSPLLGQRSLGEYRQVSRRTDSKMRKFLNLALQNAILACNTSLVEKTLQFGRENTMLLQVTDEWIQVALRVTEEDGPGQGDRTLLRILLSK